MNKVIRHRKITINYIVIPLIITIIVGFYSYFNNDVFDESVLSVLINNFFLPFYITIFGVIFSLYIESEEEQMYDIYKFQLLFIFASIILLMLLKLLFSNYF